VLTRGFVTFVSPEDAHHLEGARWHALYSGGLIYVRRHVGPYTTKHKTGTRISLHREILGVQCGDVDHVDHNGLNNRGENLRPCSRSQNLGNSRHRVSPSTGFCGVAMVWDRWRARISVGNDLLLGRTTRR
jgi:hypothetical protein